MRKKRSVHQVREHFFDCLKVASGQKWPSLPTKCRYLQGAQQEPRRTSQFSLLASFQYEKKAERTPGT
jgi:hypothetical protein